MTPYCYGTRSARRSALERTRRRRRHSAAKIPRGKDKDAFEKFLTDCCTARIGVQFRGDCHQIEHIFYKWLRCEIAHEGRLPMDIEFVQDGNTSIRAGGAPEYVLKLGTGWFAHFLNCVIQAHENEDEFQGF